MGTIVQIDGKRRDGTSSPPHLTIHDADFVPRVGDLIRFGTSEAEVTRVVFEFLADSGRPHIIHITTTG
jgi:hypothetical protein